MNGELEIQNIEAKKHSQFFENLQKEEAERSWFMSFVLHIGAIIFAD